MVDNIKNVPGPSAVLDGGGHSDADAESEAAAFASKNLDQISKQKDHNRREGFRDNAYCGAIIILWLLIIATALGIFALAAHYLTPWGWLDNDQLMAVKTYVFSGAVVAAIGGYLKKYLD